MKNISIKHPDANKDWGHGITIADLEKISIKGLKGVEKFYWQYCNIYKVNPALLMAISRQETGGDSQRLTQDHNYGGIKGKGNAGSRNGHAKYTCAEEGIRAHVSLIARLYVGKGLKTIEQIQRKYIPDNGGNWRQKIHTFYNYTGKTYSASVAGSGVSKEILQPIDAETGQGGGPEFSTLIKKQLLKANLENVTYWKKKSGNQFIVIHNTGGYNTAKETADYFNGPCAAEGRNVSAHYCVDEKEIIQTLEDSWKGAHAGGPKPGHYGADRGASNSNSIGIEIADGPSCDKEKAMNVGIELARYLVKKYNIPYDHVIRHFDVSGKPCPGWIMNNNRWDYFKAEVKRRNEENIPLSFDTTSSSTGGTDGSGDGNLPNFDNREDWTNLKEIKGVILNFLPPMNQTSTANKGDYYKKYGFDREYHYMVDSAQWIPEKDTKLIAFSMLDNDKHTYIDRALYGNKAPKYTLSVGIFCSPQLEDYPLTERHLIDNVARILYDNGLNPNDLWREFDLNRAPSPLMYLDRHQWKKLLIEIDKQYQWRIKNFGEVEKPPTDGSGDPTPNPDEQPAVKNNGIPQPEIVPTMTHEQYLKYMEYADPTKIDMYAELHEPYDKGLDEIINAPVTNDDRLSALPNLMRTQDEVNLNYNVIEATPGASDHCAKPTSELNVLYINDNLKVDPVYPDLIIPPNYSSTDHNVSDKDRVPLEKYEEFAIDDEDNFTKEYAFDFDLLKEMNKKSKGRPVNYNDPYPYDDKVVELERHHPKVKIDKWESRLYDCNHPGCPVGQPMAKNFAATINAQMSQSKKIESRLVRIENTLAVVLRNLGRMASRVNINCVYYGGQDVFGKYKTIRCLRDDRINDGCSVTMDQCLACTRYEPMIGQIYEILDETGMNGSALLDDMQMAYMDLEEMKNLNKVENRSTKYKYANATKDPKEAPKSMIDDWKAEDKKKYEEQLKKATTDEKELAEKLKAIKEEDYVFTMDWTEQILETQQADVKPYPLEGIKAKYKKEQGDAGDGQSTLTKEQLKEPNDDKKDKENNGEDKEFIRDKENYDKIVNGEWVDTREEADTTETNEHTSEDFYFEGFNKDAGGTIGGSPGGIMGAQARQNIVDMAKQICKDHDEKKAAYKMIRPATMKYENKVMARITRVNPNEDVAIYDCSSFVSTCYNAAGLTSVTNGNTSTIKAALDKGKTWPASMDTIKDCLPGDIIWKPGKINHVGIFIGDNKIAHASGSNYSAATPNKKDIRIDDAANAIQYSFNSSNTIFGRPKDLIEADEKASQINGEGVEFKGNTKEFLQSILAGAQRGQKEFGVFASVCMAQAALESSWGKSGLSTKAKNLFGIKANNWDGPYVEMNTKEEYNGKKVWVKAKFRKYNSFDDSVYDHGKFLKENPRYAKHGVFTARNWQEQIAAIRAAGYATDSSYVNLCTSIINQYKLYQYD